MYINLKQLSNSNFNSPSSVKSAVNKLIMCVGEVTRYDFYENMLCSVYQTALNDLNHLKSNSGGVNLSFKFLVNELLFLIMMNNNSLNSEKLIIIVL